MESEQSREPVANQIDTSEAVANLLCEFLEVAFHYILYVRGIYSSLLFEKARKYNTSVQVCRHPELNQYIKQILDGLSPLIEKNEIQKVLLTVVDKDRQTVEVFNFSIQNNGSGCHSDSLCGSKFLVELESQFRSFLLKISECDSVLQQLPSECSFMIMAVTRLPAATTLEYTRTGQEFPWVILDEQETSRVNSTVVPIKSMSTGILKGVCEDKYAIS